MDQNERRVLDELFGKLRQVDGQAPPRDPEAEAYIRQQIAAMPAAPYYMAQAISCRSRRWPTRRQGWRNLGGRRPSARPAAAS